MNEFYKLMFDTFVCSYSDNLHNSDLFQINHLKSAIYDQQQTKVESGAKILQLSSVYLNTSKYDDKLVTRARAYQVAV